MNSLTKASVVLVAVMSSTAFADPVTGWGLESGSQGGWTLTDNGSGNFTLGGGAQPSGNTVWRAQFSTVALGVGQSVTVSGSFSFSDGLIAGGLFRLGILNYGTPGTLSAGVWSGMNQSASGYMWGVPNSGGGIGGANPSEVTGHTGGGAWFSSNNGYSVPGGLNSNAGNELPGTYDFSLTYTLNSATSMTIAYSLVQTSGGTFSEIGSAVDNGLNAGNVATTSFNAMGFFFNGSDTLTSITFNNVGVTVVPEPSTFAIGGLGLLALVAYRRARRTA